MPTRILVVDDEVLIRQLLSYQLSGAGYAVQTVPNGREMLARLALEQPDLVLLDVMMPDMSGWDICRQIRSASSVPVIMLTGKSADMDIVTGLHAGADDYIVKPYTEQQLLARIEAVLRRSAPTARPAALPAAQPATPAPSSPTSKAASLPQPVRPAQPARPRTGIGQRLAGARRAQGLSLYQVEQGCGVRWEFLQAVEREHWNYIPRASLRKIVRTYSQFLGVDLRDLLPQRPQPAPRARPARAPRPARPVSLALTVVAVLVLLALVILSTQFL